MESKNTRFFEQLEHRAKKTLLCVGLDPRAKSAAEAKKQCLRIIEATHEYAAVYKPNAAFFEVFGAEGWTALKEVIAAVPPGIPVILDAKRGDIFATAKAYAKSAFQHLGAHAITASPYMGFDSIEPFARDNSKGVFVLCRTSNKSSDKIQYIKDTHGVPLYHQIALMVEKEWNQLHRNVGLVVGATDPVAIKELRQLTPTIWFLVPGVGTQGGDLRKVVEYGVREDGSGVLVNISRVIADSDDPRETARTICEEINRVRFNTLQSLQTSEALIAKDLLVSQCARFGEFKLKSGAMSPIYIDMRRLVSHPIALQHIAKAYAEALKGVQFDRLVGLPYAALPIATAVSLHMNKPLIYPRREGVKSYGTKAAIEGDYKKGERVVIIDDLVTTGETKIEAIEKLRSVGLVVVKILVLLDREMGAETFLASKGFELGSIVRLSEMLEIWRKWGNISEQQYNAAVEFMQKTLPAPTTTGGSSSASHSSKL